MDARALDETLLWLCAIASAPKRPVSLAFLLPVARLMRYIVAAMPANV